MKTNIFDRVSFVSLLLVIVLLPVFVLPFTSIPVEISKGLLLVVGLAVCIVSWGLGRFFDGKISFPRSMLLLSGGGVVLAFFLSALFSKASEVSFFGTMFDIGTFYFILSGFLLMLMSAIILRDPKKAKIVLFGAVLSSALVLLFQIAHIFLPKILSLGILATKNDNLLGSWNAFGIFAGFSALMCLLLVEFFPTRRNIKTILQVLFILFLAMIAVVNFTFVWELLGIAALIIFVYKVSSTLKEKNKSAENDTDISVKKTNFPIFSFIIIMVSLLFFISGDFIGGILPSHLGIQNSEVSPSFSTTVSITKSVLKAHPIFGVGPNKFSEAWAMYKPVDINSTSFWDVSFNSGSGLLPTFAATTGGFGILAGLFFLVLFVMSGIKSIFSSVKNGINWEAMAFFVLSLYLFVSCFFYSTGSVIFLLALSFTGIFIGLSSFGHPQGEVSVSYLSDHRKSFFSILFIVLVLIATAAVSFKYIQRLVSVSYFSKALTAGTVENAVTSISKALALYESDLYLRTYAQVYLVKLDSLAKKGDSLTDTEKKDLQTSLDQAVSGAQMATTYNPKNYLNFAMLGSVYQKLGSLGVKDAYSKAIEAYTTALSLNPLNPGILITLSQIAKSNGDDALALTYAQNALSISPKDSDLIKYIDFLKTPTPTPAQAPVLDPVTTTTENKTTNKIPAGKKP